MNKQSKAIKNNQNQQKGLVVGLVVGFSGTRAAGTPPWVIPTPWAPRRPRARKPDHQPYQQPFLLILIIFDCF